MEESEPLVGMLSLGHIDLADSGLRTVSRENCAVADVADEAKAKTLWRNVDGRRHRQEMVWDAANYVGAGTTYLYPKVRPCPHVLRTPFGNVRPPAHGRLAISLGRGPSMSAL